METVGGNPWWYGSVAAALGLGYAASRFWFWLKQQRRTDAAAEGEHADARTDAQEAKESRRRRESSEEAWQVVDRQNKVIEGFDAKFAREKTEYDARLNAVEAKCDAAVADCQAERDECIRERAFLQGTLNVVVAWATSKGLKMPAQFQPPGSGPHRPLADPDQETP